jgi:glycosyltransferase involved in cell wall biosynthesis
MKILRIIYDWPPPYDGLAPAPYALTKAQMAFDNEVKVICGGGSLIFKKRQTADIKNVKITRLPRTLHFIGPFFTTSPLVLVFYWYNKIFWRPNIVHGHGHVTLWFNFYKYFLGWLDRTPYVLHFHNTAAGREAGVTASGETVSLLTRFIEWPLHKLSDYLGCLVADKLVFVSEDTASEAKIYYNADPLKIFVLENGADTSLFTSKGDKKEIFKTGQILLYQGALTKRKRVDVLILSLKFLSTDVKLAIVGKKNATLESLVKSEGLEDRVRFEGYVPNNETPSYYRAADLCVSPASYEGFPKVVLESLACGTPVLASGFHVSPTVSGLRLINFATVEELAKEITKSLADLPKVDVDAIKKRFDWSVLTLKLQKIYEELAS